MARASDPLTVAFTLKSDTNAEQSLLSNGRSESNTTGDFKTLSLLAHLPILFAESPRRVLNIGLGTGVTTGAAARHPEVEHLVVAEISHAIVDLLPTFGESTSNVHEDPRLTIEIADAARLLRRSEDQWDVIISEPSNLYVSGVDQLFTAEFYGLVDQRLAPRGILMQWIQAYQMDEQTITRVLYSIASVFENIYVFRGSGGLDLLIIATHHPLGRADVERAQERLSNNPAVAADFEAMEIPNIELLVARGIYPEVLTLPTLNPDVGMETRDRPQIQFRSIRNLFLGYSLRASLSNLAEHPTTEALKEIYTSNWASDAPLPILPELVRRLSLPPSNPRNAEDPPLPESNQAKTN